MKATLAIATSILLSSVVYADGERGYFNNGVFDSHDLYGHVLSDLGPESGVRSARADYTDTESRYFGSAAFDNRELYGHVLTSLGPETAAPTQEEAEMAMLEDEPGERLGDFNNGTFNSITLYGHILRDLEVE